MATDPSSPKRNLSDEERDRLVRDVAYAQVVVEQARRLEERPRSRLARVGQVLANGFVLLLVGSALTSLLVPWIQRRQLERQARIDARRECLTQFLLYSNSRWPEYYVVIPLVVRGTMSPDEYREALKFVAAGKVARYDAAAKIEASLLAFRAKIEQPNEDVETAFHDYTIAVNDLSTGIDAWLRNAYCYSNLCEKSLSADLDPDFEPYDRFLELQSRVIALLKNDAEVANRLVRHIEDD
jgi:hypothetical protein